MKRPTDNERLFADAFDDAGPAGSREALLGETLRLARRRRRVRQMRRAGAVLMMLGLVAILFWPKGTARQLPPPTPVASYQLISTRPLPMSAIVTTRPFANQILASMPTANVITTTAQARDDLREINDDELLALAPQPAMLVRL